MLPISFFISLQRRNKARGQPLRRGCKNVPKLLPESLRTKALPSLKTENPTVTTQRLRQGSQVDRLMVSLYRLKGFHGSAPHQTDCHDRKCGMKDQVQTQSKTRSSKNRPPVPPANHLKAIPKRLLNASTSVQQSGHFALFFERQ
jgi:hypothetical protein